MGRSRKFTFSKESMYLLLQGVPQHDARIEARILLEGCRYSYCQLAELCMLKVAESNHEVYEGQIAVDGSGSAGYKYAECE